MAKISAINGFEIIGNPTVAERVTLSEAAQGFAAALSGASTESRELYFTSLREELSDAELARTPQGGGVFMLQAGVAGAPAALYKG